MALGSRAFQRAVEESNAPRGRRGRGGEFLQHVDVEDFLETLEMENVHQTTADELNFTCPFPGHTSGDAKPSAYMNTGAKDKGKATVWKCHGCGRSGNGITFYAELEGIGKQEAALHIRQTWAPGFRAPKGGSISQEFEMRLRERWEQQHAADPLPVIAWERYDKLFAVDWDYAFKQYERPDTDPTVRYLFERGFSRHALSNWRIGYDPISGRLTIPVTNADGELVGVKGRLPRDDQKPKYIALGDKENRRPDYGFMPYEKSRVIFGLDRVKLAGKIIVLVEGELDVIALWMIGVPAISTGSAHLSDEQAILIRDYFDEVIVFFDSNTAGENATWGWEDKDGDWHPGVIEKLEPFVKLRVVDEHEDDASKMVQLGQADELQALLASAPAHHKLYSA